jgi:putative transposase
MRPKAAEGGHRDFRLRLFCDDKLESGDITLTTTKPTMALAELIEKGADVDLLREMIFHTQRMMDMDVESLCAAAYGERIPERANSRNGYRERTWDTRAGTIDLKITR